MWKWLKNERTLAYLTVAAVVLWVFVFGLQVRNAYIQRQRDFERSQKLDELNAALQSLVDEITQGQQ
jgi:ABC-type siderophore export system fused ATPase/permease subunit